MPYDDQLGIYQLIRFKKMYAQLLGKTVVVIKCHLNPSQGAVRLERLSMLSED